MESARITFLFDDAGNLSGRFASDQGLLISYLECLRSARDDAAYTLPESFLRVPFDEALFAKSALCAKEIGSESMRVAVIGIGGSNLGTLAVQDALVSPEEQRLLFLDTVSSRTARRVARSLATLPGPEALCINVVSKSGSTAETAAGFEYLYHELSQTFGDVARRVVVTSDEGSPLFLKGTSLGIHTIPIPSVIGGRWSVFSPVGIFPLLAGGIDVVALLEGARAMIEECLRPDLERNPAAYSALAVWHAYQTGIRIHNGFYFNPALESTGKWYRQLMGESLGKESDNSGKTVHAGMTPIVSIGSTDLHSVGQLYIGGPLDKFTSFVYARGEEKDTPAAVPQQEVFALVPHLSGKSFSSIMEAIFTGTLCAYRKRGLPFMQVILPDLASQTIGAYLAFRMCEMVLLARLMNVNAFDQPNVESYKSETRVLLRGNAP